MRLRDARKQEEAVADIPEGDGRDDAVRPSAELLIAEFFQQELAQRRADHRGGDGCRQEPRLDLAHLLDQRAEIDQLEAMAEDLAGGLGGDDLAALDRLNEER